MPRLMGTINHGAGAFVQLRDSNGDFVGEVRADEAGQFTFHAIPGHWTVIYLTPGHRGEQAVELGPDDVVVDLPT